MFIIIHDRHKEDRLQLEEAWKESPGQKTGRSLWTTYDPGGAKDEEKRIIKYFFTIKIITWSIRGKPSYEI